MQPGPAPSSAALQESRLLGGDLDRSLGVLLLQRQPAVDPRPQPIVVEDFWMVIADTRTPSSASVASMAVAAVGRVLQRQRP